MAEQRKILQLNTDVLSYILTFVRSPYDVRSFALANRQHYLVAKPELTFRLIRCRLSNRWVWEYLIAHPVQAAKVGQLEVLDKKEGSREVVPVTIRIFRMAREGECLIYGGSKNKNSHQKEVVGERLLIKALKVLVNLESFIWERSVPLFNQGHKAPLSSQGVVLNADQRAHAPLEQEDIWTALRDHTQIKRLRVADLWTDSGPVADTLPVFMSNLFTLGGLTHFHFDLDGVEDGFGEAFDFFEFEMVTILNLLKRCPSLKSLSLNLHQHFITSSSGPDVSCIFAFARWPNLHTLKLNNATVDNDIMTRFLISHHQHLQCFCITFDSFLDECPAVPFEFSSDLDAEASSGQGPMFQKLRKVELPIPVAMHLLKTMQSTSPRPSSLRSLEMYNPMDHWRRPEKPDANSNSDSVEGEETIDVALGIPMDILVNLRSLTIPHVRTLKQLEALSKATPKMRHIHLGCFVLPNRGQVLERPHEYFLPILKNWPNLTSFEGIGSNLFPFPLLNYPSNLLVFFDILRASPKVKLVQCSGVGRVTIKKQRWGDKVNFRLERCS